MAGRIELKKLFSFTAPDQRPVYIRLDAIEAVKVKDVVDERAGRREYYVQVFLASGNTYTQKMPDERMANKLVSMLLRAIEGVHDDKTRKDKFFPKEEEGNG